MGRGRRRGWGAEGPRAIAILPGTGKKGGSDSNPLFVSANLPPLFDSVGILVIALCLLWLGAAWYAWRVYHNPREEGDVVSGLAWDFVRVYAAVYHGLRVRGREFVPRTPRVGDRPVLVVANHTAGLDPLLIQAAVPWFVRWLMAADMVGQGLDGLWTFTGVILVDRSGKSEITGVRAAVRTLELGGAVGIFPEGKLRRRPTELNPFLPGIGLIISRTRAIVLPVVIRGTPFCQTSWGSLAIPSRSSVEFKPPIDVAALGLRSSEIAPHLESRFRQWLGPSGAEGELPEEDSWRAGKGEFGAGNDGEQRVGSGQVAVRGEDGRRGVADSAEGKLGEGRLGELRVTDASAGHPKRGDEGQRGNAGIRRSAG